MADRSILGDHTFTHGKLLLTGARHQLTMCGIAEWLVKHSHKQTPTGTHNCGPLVFSTFSTKKMTNTASHLSVSRLIFHHAQAGQQWHCHETMPKKRIYGTTYMFPHWAVSLVSQDNLCSARSHRILRSFSHQSSARGRESR